MPDERPNILLIVTEHHRWDALGIEGHPVLQTPYLDEIATGGVHFRNAYTACPVRIPARRTLMTGRKPAAHGVVMNYGARLEGPTLPGELSRAGYQTHLVGKLHLWPRRRLHAEEGGSEGEMAQWRQRLIDELEGRPEGFVQDGQLQELDGPTSLWLPGYEREEDDS